MANGMPGSGPGMTSKGNGVAGPRPSQPAPGTRLIALAEIPQPGAKAFSFGAGKERFECFVVHWLGGAIGYINECPHARTPLAWPPDQFFNLRKAALPFAPHGAPLLPERGHCFPGPHQGNSP